MLETPLAKIHESLGASFTAFGQWNMPLKYGSELQEHRAVREAAGLFDLSHMGEVWVTGPQAAAFLDYALIADFSALPIGKAKYSMILQDDGGIIDDLITYRLDAERFLVIPNAGNTPAVVAALHERAAKFDVSVEDASTTTALIAVQGPQSAALLASLIPDEQQAALESLRYYACTTLTVSEFDLIVARTGYTGEDGFEIYCSPKQAPVVWERLADAGAQPCGLAARDSLRLEAGMPLYGNELNTNLTPIDAGLGVIIPRKKEADFVGKSALANLEQPARVLVGLTSAGRRAARQHAELYDGETLVGEVTSGQPSPTLGHPIALAYVDAALATPGTELEADIRGKRYPYTVVELPFYKRS